MDTFCVLPWYSKEITLTKTTPCCLLPQNYNLQQIKQDLLNGVQTPACSTCWTIESAGKQSRRQQENIFLDYKLDRDLALIRHDCIEEKNATLMYQLTTSNLCNQACVSCNSNFSTKWAQIEKRMNLVPAKKQEINLQQHAINYKNAKRITLLGGEPLFDPMTFEILQKLLEAGNDNCFISLITNGSIELNSEQKALLKNFKDLNICISIDGISKVFEYLRWPGKWSVLNDNLIEFKKLAKNTSVSYTISALNAFYYDETVQWFNEQGLEYNHNVVSKPNWLSLDCMPVELKTYFAKRENFIRNFCKPNGKEISLQELTNNLLKQDLAKKIKIQDYLPEFSKLINYCS